ncbi:MAG: major facilitator superfamily domain-containing protein [Monoraphidium minutum]|nr:MAG: major facilitator superfamily domain-containing protein [Monoraphidium minutum]
MTTIALRDGLDDEAGSEPSSASSAAAVPKPKWFTPLRLLLIFCFANIMVYLDRGVIASNGVNGSPRTVDNPKGSGIVGAFNLSNTQDGLLATGFLIGLLVASPVFSEACKHCSAFRLIAIGMGTWVVAVAGCGLAFNFGSLFACRVFVGVGEASFVALAAPFIDDYAPPEKKARWFAVFYLCIPTGYALGYVYGGLVAAALGWRAAFFIAAGVMAPFVLFLGLSAPLHLHGSRDAGHDPARPKGLVDVAREFVTDALRVGRHGVWVLMVAGYTLYAAVIGVYAFWGPKAGREIYDMKGTSADLIFGGVTVVTGVAGGLLGGGLLDWMGSTLRNANLVCCLACWGGLAMCLVSFLATRNFYAFIALFAVGELFLFTISAPVGGIGMWSVPPPLRPLGISLTTIVMHLLGDVPSPPLLGYLQTRLEHGKTPELARQEWRVSLSILTLLLAPAGAFFLWGAKISPKARDYRDKEEQMLAEARDAAHVHRSGGGAGGGGGGAGSGGGGAAGGGPPRAGAARLSRDGGGGGGDDPIIAEPLLEGGPGSDAGGGGAGAPADYEAGAPARRAVAGAAVAPASPGGRGLRARGSGSAGV